MNIGKKIAELREKYGLTRYKLSELSGVSQSALSEIERGIKQPTITTLENICKALNITLADFFAEKEPEIPPEVKSLINTVVRLSPTQIRLLDSFLKTFQPSKVIFLDDLPPEAVELFSIVKTLDSDKIKILLNIAKTFVRQEN
ncbi:transcriptional regulator with XRE-family HTH domain [Caldicellulosiruptor bescii]|uniref:Transcriptional regulator, XRE family n=2 Tax=Caldicellulosiruptor bescii TaxID=31899 RepID=B9MNZ2_CALBD|nr:helix-turn-helix transcriptional regulator [Caldicellulosiruptor bescii]ACM61551.1 transcriptional regulator, XRE family [Caldicellulosiruptor bescii DSM 6725]PBC88637.1 transcriptional regulator with XRE-family HTH domain [Caldicellulosiruptor bescii]PBC91882.1 transcriptional regulator with XRE-family HTH domain [Caldicellulosiruptor bescii]PBD02707.1 transcriptional regulator with XRE-family HTH domain [Caldicellulosiruptor bescii]PBD07676.1 transcriptional regulator with XRE-family HTH 